MAKTLALGKRLSFDAATPSHVSRPPPPTLQQLFARASPQPESSGEVANITDDEEDSAVEADAGFRNRPAGSPVRQSWENRQDQSQKSPQNAFSSLSGVHSHAAKMPCYAFPAYHFGIGPAFQLMGAFVSSLAATMRICLKSAFCVQSGSLSMA